MKINRVLVGYKTNISELNGDYIDVKKLEKSIIINTFQIFVFLICIHAINQSYQ